MTDTYWAPLRLRLGVRVTAMSEAPKILPCTHFSVEWQIIYKNTNQEKMISNTTKKHWEENHPGGTQGRPPPLFTGLASFTLCIQMGTQGPWKTNPTPDNSLYCSPQNSLSPLEKIYFLNTSLTFFPSHIQQWQYRRLCKVVRKVSLEKLHVSLEARRK